MSIPSVPGFGFGIGGSGLFAYNPTAMDDKARVTVRSNTSTFDGYGGVSVSYTLPEAWRVNVIAGYGGTGIKAYYGGLGPAFSVAVNRVFTHPSVFGGLGVRYLFMPLSYAASGSTRAERGLYMAALLEATLDWVP